MKQKVAIVVPIITPQVEGDELTSLQQCLHVLGQRDIIYLCSDELDTTFYEKINEQNHIPFHKHCFGQECFSSVEAYNKLCFSADLYTAFNQFEYMLIYQLDAFIFEDKLDYWCNQQYDYIGGPWLCHWSNEVENLNHWEVGNGGFSLRRVATFVNLLTKQTTLRKPLKGYGRFCYENSLRLRHKPYLRLWFLFRAISGYHNTLNYYILHQSQEDKAYAQCQYNGLLRIPTARKALEFSFDMRPQTCYKLTGNTLPMGCHMWYKYDNERFWYPIIRNQS